MRRFVALAALAAAGAGCGDATSSGVTPAELEGTWSATAFTFTAVADPALSLDLIASGGDVTFDFRTDGTVIVTLDLGDGPHSEIDAYTVDGSNLTITLGGDTSTGTIIRNGDLLTIDLISGVEFDVDEDGDDEPATLHAVLARA